MERDLLIAMRLAKEGFGTAEEILAQPTDIVLATVEYSTFLSDYESTHAELNRDTK